MHKKVAFITIHVGYNFGSVLQTIATDRVLREGGAEPICVNYIPPRVTERRYWEDGNTSLSRMVRRLLYYPIHIYSKHKYSRYLAKHCFVSKPIYKGDCFVDTCPKADIYISGSDQIWNYKHNEGIDGHYFFEGIQGEKIAFASSIGTTELPQDYKEYMVRALRSYKTLSVRESSAVTILSELGIKSEQLIDPTLMIDKTIWPQYASKRLVKDPYIFVYLPYNVSNKGMVYSTVRKISDRRRLKIVTFSWDYRKDKMADKTITFADPGDILSLFIYADYVVTNSFHGTAFSINLNKQFWVYMPSHFSTRLLSLIELCGLNDRMLNGVIEDNDVRSKIDFTNTNRVLGKEREKAKSFIIKALS